MNNENTKTIKPYLVPYILTVVGVMIGLGVFSAFIYEIPSGASGFAIIYAGTYIISNKFVKTHERVMEKDERKYFTLNAFILDWLTSLALAIPLLGLVYLVSPEDEMIRALIELPPTWWAVIIVFVSAIYYFGHYFFFGMLNKAVLKQIEMAKEKKP